MVKAGAMKQSAMENINRHEARYGGHGQEDTKGSVPGANPSDVGRRGYSNENWPSLFGTSDVLFNLKLDALREEKPGTARQRRLCDAIVECGLPVFYGTSSTSKPPARSAEVPILLTTVTSYVPGSSLGTRKWMEVMVALVTLPFLGLPPALLR